MKAVLAALVGAFATLLVIWTLGGALFMGRHLPVLSSSDPECGQATLHVPSGLSTSEDPYIMLNDASSAAFQASTPQPTRVPLPPINFTRADYENAISNWNAQAATEYEEVVSYFAFSPFTGKWRLRVQVAGGVEQVVEFERIVEGKGGIQFTGEDLKFLTVGSILGRIGAALAENETPEKAAAATRNRGFAYAYTAGFDPALGFPTTFRGSVNEDPVTVADAGFSFNIESVTVLQTGAQVPGMPRTGSPDR